MLNYDDKRALMQSQQTGRKSISLNSGFKLSRLYVLVLVPVLLVAQSSLFLNELTAAVRLTCNVEILVHSQVVSWRCPAPPVSPNYPSVYWSSLPIRSLLPCSPVAQ